MNHKKTIIKAFTDMAPQYEQKVDAELQRFMGWGYEEFISKFLEHTSILDSDKVLDIATGTSLIPRTLMDRGKLDGQIVGLDITPAMLYNAKSYLSESHKYGHIQLTCASSNQLPFRDSHFDHVTCGLASHHMHVQTFTQELYRVLRPGGDVTIADVSANKYWRAPFVVPFIRIAAFLYFSPLEGPSRALAEASSLSNIYTASEWHKILSEVGFTSIQVTTLSKTHFWSPIPVILHATKPS